MKSAINNIGLINFKCKYILVLYKILLKADLEKLKFFQSDQIQTIRNLLWLKINVIKNVLYFTDDCYHFFKS